MALVGLIGVAGVAFLPTVFGRLSSASAPLASSSPGGLPACANGELPALHSGLDDWRLTLLDTAFALPADYAPRDLADSADAGLNAGYPLRSVVVADLRALVDAARAGGVALGVVSGYRSYDYQARTFAQWEANVGREAALDTSARAGHSEHQLGTALDFSNARLWAPWDVDDWATTPAGAWLEANAWRYGFVMSYPRDAKARSCYEYEPWHYRYVGRDLAAQMHEDGRTPREALWNLEATGPKG